MKITKDKILIRLDRLADGAMFFGAGYVLLSTLKAGTANVAGWIIFWVGFVVSLVLIRWRRQRQQRFRDLFKWWRGEPALILAFKKGATKDEVIRQLEEGRASILTDTPEHVMAEVCTARSEKPTRVEITFADGKLTKTVIHEQRPNTY